VLYVEPASLQFSRAQGSESAAPRERETAALKELEQFFLYQLLGEMRKTVGEGGLFDRGGAMAVFEDMMDDAVAKQMADSGQMGVAAAIEAQLRVHDVQKQLSTAFTDGHSASEPQPKTSHG
jgi:Rod binding domain-containing protein